MTDNIRERSVVRRLALARGRGWRHGCRPMPRGPQGQPSRTCRESSENQRLADPMSADRRLYSSIRPPVLRRVFKEDGLALEGFQRPKRLDFVMNADGAYLQILWAQPFERWLRHQPSACAPEGAALLDRVHGYHRGQRVDGVLTSSRRSRVVEDTIDLDPHPKQSPHQAHVDHPETIRRAASGRWSSRRTASRPIPTSRKFLDPECNIATSWTRPS